MTHVYLPIITALLGIITTILGFGGVVFYRVIAAILEEVRTHARDIAELKTWEMDHKDEVRIQRQHFADVASRVERRVQDLEMTVRRFHGNGPVLP